jgi:hypothetical protein
MSEQHGPVHSTWFGRGVWPTCTCGYAPKDNVMLNAHWAEHGFRVYHDTRTGQLVKDDLRQREEG